MHKRFWSTTATYALLLLTLIAYAVAQPVTRDNQECPRITIECPTELPEGGKTYTVSADVEGAVSMKKITYHWSLSSAGECGEIIEGQGTPSIKVRIKCTYQTTTATVKICGLEDKCKDTESCSFSVS
jgi:hypothetical protein